MARNEGLEEGVFLPIIVRHDKTTVFIPAGEFLMGCDQVLLLVSEMRRVQNGYSTFFVRRVERDSSHTS